MLTRQELIEIRDRQCRSHGIDPERRDIQGMTNNLLSVILTEAEWEHEELIELRTFVLEVQSIVDGAAFWRAIKSINNTEDEAVRALALRFLGAWEKVAWFLAERETQDHVEHETAEQDHDVPWTPAALTGLQHYWQSGAPSTVVVEGNVKTIEDQANTRKSTKADKP